jgi:hypothetical protein
MAVLAVLVCGCATMQTIDISSRSRIVNADYATTLKASIDYLNSEGWQIATVDREFGLINTEFRSSSDLGSIFFGGERYKLNLSIQRFSVDQTRVIANMLHETKSHGHLLGEGSWVQARVTEGDALEQYYHLLGGIEAKVQSDKKDFTESRSTK